MKNRIRTLLLENPSTGGRNNTGKQTVRHRGGAVKHLYRQIDWKRNLIQLSATVLRIEKDPNRNCFIALICYKHGLLTYIISPHGLSNGNKIESGIKVAPTLGNTMLLKYILIGSFIHNIELKPGKGAQIARSAGSYALLLHKTKDGYATLRLSSGEIKKVSVYCIATIGIVSNPLWSTKKLYKAGQSRWIGRRPAVRGVAMNPVDHPHGGGQGKTKGGRPSVSPQGIYTKGIRTRKNKRTSFTILKRRHS